MSIEDRIANRRRRPVKPHVSYISTDYAVPFHDEDDEWWFPDYYYQISNTLGLSERFDHPELEAFITFDVAEGGYSVLRYLCSNIEKGAKYKAGDRIELPLTNNYGGGNLDDLLDELTDDTDSTSTCRVVEFVESQNSYGPCLRAVVLGIEEKYQSLSENDAIKWLYDHGPLIDPYENM